MKQNLMPQFRSLSVIAWSIKAHSWSRNKFRHWIQIYREDIKWEEPQEQIREGEQ